MPRKAVRTATSRSKDKLIRELKEKIEIMEIKLRHMENNFFITREENEATTEQYLNILSNLEGQVRERTSEIEKINDNLKQEIEEHKKTERKLRENEQFLQNLFNAIQAGIAVLDTDYNILRVNSWVERNYGFAETLIGRKCHDVFQQTGYLCESCPTWETLATGKPAESIVPFLVANNQLGWLELSTYPLVDDNGEVYGIIEHLRDITERKRAEEALIESEDRFRNLFEHSQLGIYRTTTEGKIILINPALLEMLGFDMVNQTSGYNVESMGYVDASERREFERLIREKGFVKGFTSRWKRVDGGEIHVRENARAVRDNQGNILYYEGTVEDISQEIKAKEKLDQYREHLENMVQVRTIAMELANTKLQNEINERKQAEEALRQSETRFRAMFDQSSIGVSMLDLDYIILDANHAMQKMLGVNHHELLGRTIDSFIHPDDIHKIKAYRRPAQEGKYLNYQIERRFTRGDGTIMWGRLSISFIYQGDSYEPEFLVGMIEDVSSQKSAERALKNSEEQYRDLVEKAGMAILMDDARGRLSFCNRKFRELFGYAQEDLGDLTFESLVHPEERDLFLKDRQKREQDGEETGRFEFRGYNAKQEELFIEVETQRLIDNGRIIGSRYYMWDITERKRAEAALQMAKEAAEEANRLKSQFFFNVSHEIRTPLNIITGFSELILYSDSMEEHQDKAQMILKEADVLLQLIDQLLDHAKLEAGKLEIELHPFDLLQMLNALDSGFQVKARDRKINFSIEIDSDVPRYVRGDALRIRQILVNLINNAIKFTEKGSVTVTVEVPEVVGDTFHIVFRVIDTGIGIPAEKQQTIFQSFTQADGATTRKYGGTGLGTTIALQLVQIMNGQIGVESEPGKGSTFWFILPLDLAEAPNEEEEIILASEPRKDLEETYHQVQGFILLVDDYPVNRELARNHLNGVGHTVELAENGRIGSEMAAKKRYDLILMDIQMPEMDGFQATRTIRASEGPCANVPIIAMTAHADLETRKECRKIGMNDIVTKPIRRKTFLHAVTKWLLPEEVREQFLGISAATQAPEPKKQTQPILYETAIEEFGNNKELLDMVLKRFLDDLDKQTDQMREAIAQSDAETLRQISHKIRGSAANLTAMPLAEASEKLEAIGKSGDLAPAPAAFKNFIEQVEDLKNFVNGLNQ